MKSATFVHACFGPISSPPARCSARTAECRRRAPAARCSRSRASHRPERAERERLGLVRLAVRRIAEIERRDASPGMTLSAIPASSRVTETTSQNSSPLDDRRARRELEERHEAADGTLERAVGEPRPRGVPARAVEREPRDDVAEAAGVDREIRRLEDDRERRFVHELGAVEERRERVVLGGQLLAAEEQQRDVARPAPRSARRRASSSATASPPFMSLAPTPCTAPSSMRPGRLSCAGPCRSGPASTISGSAGRRGGAKRNASSPANSAVQPAGRARGGARGSPPREPLCDGMFTSSSVRAARRSASAVTARSVPRHNLAVTARQPDPAPGAEPERAFLVGVYPKGSDGADELDELRELARTVGRRARRRDRAAPRPPRSADVRRQGEARGAEGGLRDGRVRGAARRRRAQPDAAALARGRARRPRRRPDAADPRHLRPARAQLRGQAPGRARAARVQPPAHAGMWQHLERLGGGVGTRGPGESQLETDRRLARTRVSLLKRRLRALQGQRSTRRKERLRTASPTIALAGYTNVGKSTLLNALTGAHASVDDRLFETLDPTTRAFEHDGQALPRDRHRRVHPPPADAARRGLRGDARGDARRRPRPARRRRVASGGAARARRSRAVHDRPRRDRRRRHPGRARPQQGRRARSARRAAASSTRTRARSWSPPHTGEGLDALKERIAELFSDRFEDVRLLVPVRGRASAHRALRARRADRGAARHAGGRARPCAAAAREAARFARYLVAEDGHELEASAT